MSSPEDRLMWCAFKRRWLPMWPAPFWMWLAMSSDLTAEILFREVPKR